MENPLKVIGKYQIVAPLGKGAMGMVFKAFDRTIGRAVALKVIHPHLLGSEMGKAVASRFLREAQAAGRLIHPNIVSIFEYGEERGTPFIAMEMVEGADFKELLKDHVVLSPTEVVRVMGQVLDALDYAHAHGVVHRDIKPANIVRLTTGLVKVMDFGIARLEASTLTQTGAVLGSPSYMSPEQVLGQKVDGRSDLFSAGVVCFELLTGEKLFQGQGLTATMHKILHYHPPNPSDLNPTIPASFNPVMQRAMAKRADDRFQTAAEFKHALEGAGGTGRGEAGLGVMGHAIPETLDPEPQITAMAANAFPGGATYQQGSAFQQGGTFQQSGLYPRETLFSTTSLMAGRRVGPVYIPIPVRELPAGRCGVDLYLTFKGNFVLFRGKNLPMDDAILSQWEENGIERIYVRQDQFGEFLNWVYRQGDAPAMPGAASSAPVHYLQERLYPVEAATLGRGGEIPFPIYAFYDNTLFPILAPDIPGVAKVVDPGFLNQFRQLYIHLRDIDAYFEYINTQLGRDARISPMNRKGAALLREKMRVAAYSLFNSDKVGKSLVGAKGSVMEMLDLIANNPDTYYAMLAVNDLDANTYIHSANVTVLSLGLGYAMGLKRPELQTLGFGALLHDIGKREIGAQLLFKRSPISPQEYEQLKEHVLLGRKFCESRSEIPRAVADIILQHHERLDGTGYPQGLQGDEISILSQVVAIMEVFDALTSNQPFRKALSPFQALKRLRGYQDKLNQELIKLFVNQLGVQVLPGE